MNKNKGFTMVPDNLIIKAATLFSYSQFRVLLRLMSYDWSNIDTELKRKKAKSWGLEISPNGLVWPAQETLAKDLGLHINTIQQAVKQLKEMGVVEAKRQFNKPSLVSIKYDRLATLLD